MKKNNTGTRLLWVLLLILAGTTTILAQDTLPEDKYIFITAETRVSGTVENPMFIDFPTFYIYPGSGSIKSHINVNLTQNTQVITGNILIFQIYQGGGISSALRPFESLEEPGLFTASTDGTVTYTYHGRGIILPPGESFRDAYRTDSYSGMRGELTVEFTLINYGIWDKSGIMAPNLPLTPVLCGDVNGDGVVDIVDASMLGHYTLGTAMIDPIPLEVGDVNSSGAIDIIDILVIAQYAVGLITSLNCPHS